MKKLKGAICLFLSIVVCSAVACVATPLSGTASKEITVRAIQDKPLEFSGKPIKLTGIFRGWQGDCKSSPPKSRSDWMIEDGTGCIYVHGPLPSGLKPMSPGDETVSLKAIVRLTDNGSPYLEIIEP